MGDSLKWCAEHAEEVEAVKTAVATAARTPAMGMVAAYGAPSVPWEDPQPFGPYIPIPEPEPNLRVVLDNLKLAAPRKLRVSTMREATGELKLKVYVDGVLVYEATSMNGTTITVETTV